MIGKRTSHKSTFVDIAKVDRVLFWQTCTLSAFSSLQCGFRHSFRINRARLARTTPRFKLPTSVDSTSHVLSQIGLEGNFAQA